MRFARHGLARNGLRAGSARNPVVHMSVRLAQCRNLLTAVGRRSIEDSNLTLPQFELLVELSRAGENGRPFVALSRELLVTSGNLTGVVDRLEALGLVRRHRDTRDRRVVRVALTARGQRLTRSLLPRYAGSLRTALGFMSRPRLQRLSRLLDELCEGLEEVGEKR